MMKNKSIWSRVVSIACVLALLCCWGLAFVGRASAATTTTVVKDSEIVAGIYNNATDHTYTAMSGDNALAVFSAGHGTIVTDEKEFSEYKNDKRIRDADGCHITSVSNTDWCLWTVNSATETSVFFKVEIKKDATLSLGHAAIDNAHEGWVCNDGYDFVIFATLVRDGTATELSAESSGTNLAFDENSLLNWSGEVKEGDILYVGMRGDWSARTSFNPIFTFVETEEEPQPEETEPEETEPEETEPEETEPEETEPEETEPEETEPEETEPEETEPEETEPEETEPEETEPEETEPEETEPEETEPEETEPEETEPEETEPEAPMNVVVSNSDILAGIYNDAENRKHTVLYGEETLGVFTAGYGVIGTEENAFTSYDGETFFQAPNYWFISSESVSKWCYWKVASGDDAKSVFLKLEVQQDCYIGLSHEAIDNSAWTNSAGHDFTVEVIRVRNGVSTTISSVSSGDTAVSFAADSMVKDIGNVKAGDIIYVAVTGNWEAQTHFNPVFTFEETQAIPETGDEATALPVVILLLSAAALVCTVSMKKKSSNI